MVNPTKDAFVVLDVVGPMTLPPESCWRSECNRGIFLIRSAKESRGITKGFLGHADCGRSDQTLLETTRRKFICIVWYVAYYKQWRDVLPDNEGYVLTNDRVRLYYRLLGDGPVTVVIPAACLLLEDLRPLAKDHHLVFYDPRGRGQSGRDPDPAHIWTDYEVRDLETVRQYFGLEQMALLGWSYLGGIVALYAGQHPKRVSRMVMMCPLSPRSPAPYDDLEAAQHKEQIRIDPVAAGSLREMMASGQHIDRPESFCRQFQRVIVPRQLGRPEALAQMKSDPCACPNEWWHNLHEHHEMHAPPETRNNYDWRDRMSQVTASVLVVHGMEDLIPLGSSREWVDILPQARLLAIEGVGHYPHLEAPDISFPAVGGFLKGQWPEEAIKAT